MDVSDALDLLNGGIIWPPGVAVTAVDHRHRYEDAVLVRVTLVDARDSAERFAPDYPETVPGGAYADFPILLGALDGPADLVGAVLDILAGVRSHEDREFTRLADTLDAPFHPHTRAGIAAWSERTGIDPRVDLTYGVG